MRGPRLFFRILKSLWSNRKGDGTHAHVLRQTDGVMDAAGFGRGVGPAFSDDMINALSSPPWDSMWHDDFMLTAAQVDLIKRAQLTWESVEAGAPKLSPKAPYAGGTTSQHLDRILGAEASEDAKRALLLSMVQAFSVFCTEADIQPDTYETEHGTIKLTEDLIALVRHLQWDWADQDDMDQVLFDGEVAGPRCDAKRPYGDMSFYALDVHRILGWETLERTEQGYIQPTDQQIADADDLHSHILPALSAVLRHGTVAQVAS